MPVEFQTFLNIIGLVGVSAIFYGLWTCLEELEKIREFNGNLASTIVQMAQRTDLSSSNFDKLVGQKNSFPSQRSKRGASNRGTNLPEFIYDPFSSLDKVSILHSDA